MNEMDEARCLDEIKKKIKDIEEFIISLPEEIRAFATERIISEIVVVGTIGRDHMVGMLEAVKFNLWCADIDDCADIDNIDDDIL